MISKSPVAFVFALICMSSAQAAFGPPIAPFGSKSSVSHEPGTGRPILHSSHPDRKFQQDFMDLSWEMGRRRKFAPSMIGAVLGRLGEPWKDLRIAQDYALDLLDNAVMRWPRDPNVGEFFLKLIPVIPEGVLAERLAGWNSGMHLPQPAAAAAMAGVLLKNRWNPELDFGQPSSLDGLIEQVAILTFTQNSAALAAITAGIQAEGSANQRLQALLRGDDGPESQAKALGLAGVLQLQSAESLQQAERLFLDTNSEHRLDGAGALVLAGHSSHADAAFQVLVDAAKGETNGSKADLYLLRAQQLKLRKIPVDLRVQYWSEGFKTTCGMLLYGVLHWAGRR